MGVDLRLQCPGIRHRAALANARCNAPPGRSPARSILLLAGVMLFSVLAPLHAQETSIPRFEAGPAAGIGYGLQSGACPIFGGSTACGIFSGGRIINPWAGGVAQWQQLFGDRLGLE